LNDATWLVQLRLEKRAGSDRRRFEEGWATAGGSSRGGAAGQASRIATSAIRVDSLDATKPSVHWNDKAVFTDWTSCAPGTQRVAFQTTKGLPIRVKRLWPTSCSVFRHAKADRDLAARNLERGVLDDDGGER